MPTVIIGAGLPSSCRDQNKQEDVRRCLPSRKHLLLTFLTPDLSSSPTFLIKNHSRFGLLSFFLSPPSCFATSCTVALQPLQPSSFSYDAIDHVSSPPHVHDRALSVTLHPDLRRGSPSIIYTLLSSLHTLSAAITGVSGEAAGRYRLRHAGPICVFSLCQLPPSL